jgi:hypothetical protein
VTDEERSRLTAIEDPELRTWVRGIILHRDVARAGINRLVVQHAERAQRLRRIEEICKEQPW